MRQLSLFKGRRQRGIKSPAPLEFKLHCALADVCRRWLSPNWKFTHVPLGERRSPITAARLKRMGVTPGWPDFLFVGPGAPFWLELKREGAGRMSEAQVDVMIHLMACGHGYLCTDSLKDAVASLVARKILIGKIEVQ